MCLRVLTRIVPCMLAAASASAGGCGDDSRPPSSSSTTTTAATGGGGHGGSGPAHVALTFEGRVGKSVFRCADLYPGLGTAATEVRVTDFRLYVHDVRLHAKGGGDVAVDLDQNGLWQYQNVALLDFEDRSGSCANGTVETNGMLHGTVPQGEYDGISFKLGVPFDLDHADVSTAPSPLNLSALFWNWNYGYKFLRVDSVPTAAGSQPFDLHLGSTECVGDFADGGVSACGRPNVPEVVLSGFDPAKNKIVVDYAAVVAASDLSKDGGGDPGCMSDPTDPDCAPIFQRLGLDVGDGSTHPHQQKLFSVE